MFGKFALKAVKMVQSNLLTKSKNLPSYGPHTMKKQVMCFTSQFAPLFKKRVPANLLDLLAIRVTYTGRP